MAQRQSRAARRRRVHLRGRGKVLGTQERPRLCVFRSLKHIYAQLIVDSEGRTLATVGSLKVGDKRLPNGGNVAAARQVGEAVAAKALDLGVKKVVFDRNGNIYTGRIKALADAARKGGLEF